MDRVVLAWSGGKDAAFALRDLRRDPSVEVVSLLTTVSEEYDRSSMHGVRRGLHDRQAAAVGLPISYVQVPAEGSNEAYEDRMGDAVADLADRGVDAVAFADLFLEDVRAYREDMLSHTSLRGCFPLWGRDTEWLAREFAESDFKAIVVCVDGSVLDRSFLGREFDEAFLADLPGGVDPCGENGEFHTFVRDGPIFDEPVVIERGERVTRELGGGVFHYCDLLAAGGGGS